MNVLLGICGSIAAYKVLDYMRLLKKNQFNVQVVLTQDALQFVTQTTVGTLSGNTPYQSLYEEVSDISHLGLAENASLLVIAPATANTISKLALGICDSLLSTLFLGFKGPKLICPAMHSQMWENPLIQSHITTLSQHGCHILGPLSGDLACGDEGIGRLVDPQLILEATQSLVKDPLPLKHKKILITSGGTSEPIDPVRTLSNASTGKLGQSLAHMAAFMGAHVSVISTKPILENPLMNSINIVSTASEMHAKVQELAPTHDTVIMAAAVSDFTIDRKQQKINRQPSYQLKLKKTPDILASLSPHKSGKTFIGFSLSNEDMENTALTKLNSKNLDYIISNDTKNIGSDTRSIRIYSEKGLEKTLSCRSMTDTSYEILKLIPS